jgi:hypothetical protein
MSALMVASEHDEVVGMVDLEGNGKNDNLRGEQSSIDIIPE